MTGVDTPDLLDRVAAWRADEVDDGDAAELDALVAAGCRSVVMTLGSRGSLVHDGGSSPTAIPSAKVDVVDSTGAGDAFVGALVGALARRPTSHPEG